MKTRDYFMFNVSGIALGVNAPQYTVGMKIVHGKVPENPDLVTVLYLPDVHEIIPDDSPLGRKLYPKYLGEVRRAMMNYVPEADRIRSLA